MKCIGSRCLYFCRIDSTHCSLPISCLIEEGDPCVLDSVIFDLEQHIKLEQHQLAFKKSYRSKILKHQEEDGNEDLY
jgi:hypothetical protein